MKILITSPAFKNAHMKTLIEQTEASGMQVVLNPYGRTMTAEETMALWDGADAIVAGLEPYTADVLKKAPDTLKVIARFGVGYDSVDCAAAREKGIAVTNTPGVNSDAVADLAVGMMIAVARRMTTCDQSVRDGSWKRYTGDSVNGKKLGILGLGAIGKGVAKRASGFGMKVYAYDPYFNEEFARQNGVQRAELDEIFETCDYITLHLPVLPETRHVINTTTLQKMKPTAYLINAARGPLVDEDALYTALKNGTIAGAALDVYSEEPLKNSPLFDLENIVVLPHIGGNTKEAAIAMGQMAIDSARQILNGQACRNIVNP